MKLKNIIKIGSFVVAGTLPTTSQGQVYMCQACPAGTYSDGNSTSCTACSGNTYSAAAAGSCTSCPSGQFANSSKTGCINVRNATKLVSQVAKATIATCTTATLDPYQPYRVILRGGKGGNTESGAETGAGRNPTCTGGNGAEGGFVEYNFYVETKQTVELCAGGNGGDASGGKCYSAGGGAGSWIKFADNTFIAVGGGGGASSKKSLHYVDILDNGSGGGGGGIGAGGSGCASTRDQENARYYIGKGGSVGNYAGGSMTSRRDCEGRGGQGYLKNGSNGTCEDYEAHCDSDSCDYATGVSGGTGGGGGGASGDTCVKKISYSGESFDYACRLVNPTPERNYITVKVVTNSNGKISGVSKSISIGGNGADNNNENMTAGTSTTPTNVGLSGKCSDTGWGCAEIWKVTSY